MLIDVWELAALKVVMSKQYSCNLLIHSLYYFKNKLQKKLFSCIIKLNLINFS